MSPLADVNEQNVDRSLWPIHHRWRAINKCLEAGLLVLSEVEDGYHLELSVEEKSSEPEEKVSDEKSSKSALEAERGLTNVV